MLKFVNIFLHSFHTFYSILIKNYKALFISIIISTVISLFFFIVCITSIVNYKTCSLKFLIPTIVIIFNTFLITFLNNKLLKIAKIITCCINWFIIIVIQVFGSIFYLGFISELDNVILYKNPEYYEQALNSINHTYRVAHFPQKLPQNAEDIELATSSCVWFGSEAILVKFNIDPVYISNELKKYNFISIEHPQHYKHEFDDAMTTDNGRIKLDNFTFYVINDWKNEHLEGHQFPYHYGIGVNKELGQILYYYTCPD